MDMKPVQKIYQSINVQKRYMKRFEKVLRNIYWRYVKMYLISESVGTRVEDKFNIRKSRNYQSHDF